MNVYESITNEELVDKLEKYEWDPDWDTSFLVGNESNEAVSTLLKVKPEIWKITLNLFHQYKPSNKERRERMLKTLETYYESLGSGLAISRYVDYVNGELGRKRRWRTQWDIKAKLDEEFSDYITETESFLEENINPFMLKKLAEKLARVAEVGIRKVKAKSSKQEAS